MILSSLRTPLTVQGDTLGSPLTISLPSLGRPVALRYRCGEKAGSIAGPGKLTRVEWAPPLTLAEEYPDRDQIPLKLILDACVCCRSLGNAFSRAGRLWSKRLLREPWVQRSQAAPSAAAA